MGIYQVKDWDEHFENNKSRERDSCSYLCVPNKQDGMGLTRILALKDGASIYGVWNLIIGACSRQPMPRNGWLTDDGTENGRPWTVEDLALRWRRETCEIKRALDVLCNDNLCWMREIPSSARVVPAKCPSGAPEGKGREEKGIEEKEHAAHASAVTEIPSAAAALAPAVLKFPTAKGNRKGPAEWILREDFLGELQGGYPGVDVLGECRKALLWIRTDPKRTKTSDGMKRFLFSWMARCQNRGGSYASTPPNGDVARQSASDLASARAAKLLSEKRGSK